MAKKRLRPIDVPSVSGDAITQYHNPGYVRPEVMAQLRRNQAAGVQAPRVLDPIMIHSDEDEKIMSSGYKKVEDDLD